MKYEQHDVSPRTPEIFRAAGIGNALGWFDWTLYATTRCGNDPQSAGVKISNPRNDKALNNQGFVVHKMAEAMGFELMDLLQSTVFKTAKESR